MFDTGEFSVIRKARAVWRGSDRAGNSDLSSDSEVLENTAYSFRIRFESEKGTNPQELIVAAHAGCLAMALALRLQDAGYTPTELNTEAAVTLEQDKEDVRISRSALTLRASIQNPDQDTLSQDAEQNGSVSRVGNLTARYLVVDVCTSQSIYSIPDHPAHADPLIQQFERWARGRLAEGFSLDQAAEALATSKRTLARRTQSVLGKSPFAFVQDLRIERAVHLLRTSHASVDQIAAEVGYAEGVTLRALLRRRLGRGVREIRRSL
jgi:OsmC subfamily peroxiredoxin